MKPGYKQTEVGVIPEDWEVKTLGELNEPGRTISYGIVQTGKFIADGIPCVRVVDIHGTKLSDIDKLIRTSNEISNSYKRTILKKGDLITVLRGNVGDTVLVDEQLAGANLTRGVAVIPLNKEVDGAFMAGYLSSSLGRHRLNQEMNGSALQEISISNLRKFIIPLPPLPEQRAIASALSDIDALLAAQDRLIAKKRDLKTAAMQSLLSGKQRLPGFAGAWVERKLGECFTFLSTANYSRAALGKNGPVGYIHYGDIHKSNKAFFNLSLMSLPTVTLNMVQSYALVEDGDLIMADASEDLDGIGKCIEVKGIGSAKVIAGLHTFLMRGRPELLAQGFRGYLQQMPNFRAELIKLASGISVYGISKSSVGSVSLKLPPLDEQRAIAQVLSDMDAEIEALEAQRDKTAQIKQGMMQELLTGKTRLV